MKKYNVNETATNLITKTKKLDILWNRYDYSFDNNLYSKRYFMTVPFLLMDKAVFCKYKNGYIYLVPAFTNCCGLFLQSSEYSTPVCINSTNNSIISNSQVQKLYDLVSEQFANVESFIDDINH